MELFAKFAVTLAFLAGCCLTQNENSCEIPDRKCSHFAALVPARAGSRGIKDKNLSRIGNETLLARTLRIVNECGKFDSVWVSTDGNAIANEAVAQGAKVHWRDPKTATDNASTVSAVEDFLLNHEGPLQNKLQWNLECNFVAVIQCTSPFIQKNFICKAIDDFLNSDTDCVFSVTRSHQLRWIENNDGFVSALNFNPKKRPRRQDWKGELVENGMFYLVKRDLVLGEKILQNDRCKTTEIPKQFSMEIDTKFDLMLARAMLLLLKETSN